MTPAAQIEKRRPLTRAPVQLDERKTIPNAWKEAARGRSNGVCAYPECEVSSGLEYDHILALGLGGKHRAENIQPLCGPHHLQKTRLDVKMIARAKRLAGETGQYARRQKRGGSSIKSAPFPKTQSRWPTRKMRSTCPAKPQKAHDHA